MILSLNNQDGRLAILPFLNDSDSDKTDRRHSSITSSPLILSILAMLLGCAYSLWKAFFISPYNISRSPWLSVFTNLLRRIYPAYNNSVIDDIHLLMSHWHPELLVSQCGENWNDVFCLGGWQKLAESLQVQGGAPLPVNEYARWLARTLVGQKIKVLGSHWLSQAC